MSERIKIEFSPMIGELFESARDVAESKILACHDQRSDEDYLFARIMDEGGVMIEAYLCGNLIVDTGHSVITDKQVGVEGAKIIEVMDAREEIRSFEDLSFFEWVDKDGEALFQSKTFPIKRSELIDFVLDGVKESNCSFRLKKRMSQRLEGRNVRSNSVLGISIGM